MFQFWDQNETQQNSENFEIPFAQFLGQFGTETRLTTSPDVCVKVRIACELETTSSSLFRVSIDIQGVFQLSHTHIGCSCSAFAINASSCYDS